jgi:hypothetical protein
MARRRHETAAKTRRILTGRVPINTNKSDEDPYGVGADPCGSDEAEDTERGMPIVKLGLIYTRLVVPWHADQGGAYKALLAVGNQNTKANYHYFSVCGRSVWAASLGGNLGAVGRRDGEEIEELMAGSWRGNS